MYRMLDIMRNRELHIGGMYEDVGHCMFAVLDDDMYYTRCHTSSVYRNGKIRHDLLMPRKYNRDADVFEHWCVIE
jgi:hypothetical protein